MAEEGTLQELSEESRARIDRMFYGCQEIIGVEHLESVFRGAASHSGDNQISAYIGLEPSGKAHLGWVILGDTIRNLLDEGVNVIILLADWHAWVNDKFSGVMEDIQTTAKYMEETFRALLGNPPEGEGPGELRFLWASSIMDSGDYWARVLRCSKNMSLARVRRTFSIMGRSEDSSDGDLSRFFYPALQAADIFEMNIDVAIGGMDQRKAHMYMRDVADRWGWYKATCLHTPIISGLKSSGARMESFDHKMSKSDPNGAILLHDSEKKLAKKMRKAYLDPENPDSPVYELLEEIILPEFGEVIVTPKPEFGKPSVWNDLESFRNAISDGTLHPFDAKMGVAAGISRGLRAVSEYFESNPETLDRVNQLTK